MRRPFITSPKSKANARLPGLPEAERCVVCARPIADPSRAAWVRLLTTGELADRAEIVDAADDRGFFPVGPECARKLPKAFHFANEIFK